VGMDTDLYHNKDLEMPPTDRTTLKRLPDRGTRERAQIHAILDAAYLCHVGIETESGPVVIPTAFGRVGERLYLHGSPASRLLRTLRRGVPVCVTVTLVDGLVLARSTFHHSLNYRSVVLFGTATEVVDLDERAAALASFVEHVVPGRTAEVRPASPKEVRGTMVLALPIEEASAKVRTGPPIDEPDDLDLPVWGGVVPLHTVSGPPEPDAHNLPGVPLPAFLG
jgi:uncharacterized protein